MWTLPHPGIGRVWLLPLALVVAGRAAGQARASENLHWRAAREYQQQLSLAAEGYGLTLSLELSSRWDELDAHGRRLLALARELDAEQARLAARDAALLREWAPLDGLRLALDHEATDLQTEYDACRGEDAALVRDNEALAGERGRIEAAMRSAADPSSLNPQVNAWNERRAALLQRVNDYAARVRVWNGRRDDWNARHLEHERQRVDFNQRREQLIADWDAFQKRESSDYNPVVEAWERRLIHLRELQEREARRIEEAARTLARPGPAPDLKPPQPRLEGEGSAEGWLSSSALAEATTDLLAVAGQVVTNPATKAVGLTPWGTATIVTAKALYDGLKGAERAEERRLRADLDRLRRLPGVIRALDAYARRLDERVQSGEVSRAEKRRLLGERAREMVSRLPGSGPDDGERLAANIFSPEAGYGVVTSVGSWFTGHTLAHAASPLMGDAVPRAFRRLLGTRAQGVAATQAFFALGAKRITKNTASVLREAGESSGGVPELSATPVP